MQLSLTNADAYYAPPPEAESERIKQVGKDLHYLQARLGGLNMEIGNTVVVSQTQTVDPWVLAKKSPAPYSVDQGKTMTPRKRTAQGKSGQVAALAVLPESVPLGWEFLDREVCAARCRETVYVDAGPVQTLGRIRKAYPGYSNKKMRPVTREEARVSLVSTGIELSKGMDLTPHKLGSETHPIYVNLKSSNGLPVMGKFEGRAAELVVQIHDSLANQVKSAFARGETDGVLAWVRGMAADAATAQYVTCLGRCKADYYKLPKVYAAEMRFYNVFPRPLLFIMQRATQVMDGQARSILDDPTRFHSFSGVRLTRGGAQTLVEALDAQLAETGRAFVHMGDDSWVAYRDRGGVVHVFALDCSNFDLTQHGDVTSEVHNVMQAELAKVDPESAALWYVYMRGRPVITTGSLVRWWFHGGPSGAPLQSKVNGVLMDVCIRRALSYLDEVRDVQDTDVELAVERAGASMGFTVKLEQYQSHRVPSLRAALQVRPFLFVGYYFYDEGGRVKVFCDLPRQLAQMPYPGLKWIEQGDVAELEAVRLGSTVLAWGEPPAAAEAAYNAVRDWAIKLLVRVGASMEQHERAKWATQAEPGADLSVLGLLNAVRRGPEAIWADGDMGGESRLVDKSANVARVMSLAVEEVAVVRPRNLPVRSVKPARWRVPGSYDTEVHGPNRANDGRPPPVTVWAPDKAPRVREAEQIDGGRVRKGTRRGRKDWKGVDWDGDDMDWSDYGEDDDESWDG
jgi:hypothetical protein